MKKSIKIIIDKNILNKYHQYYFNLYPKRKKVPIEKPIPPSLNMWMIMPRFKMNALKQIWKEFGNWLVNYYKLENKRIDNCKIVIEYFFPDKKRRDSDNFTPKNLFDSFTSQALLIDDDFEHIKSLTIIGNYSKDNPRTEITIYY